MPIRDGQVLLHYRVAEKIGAGGMGEVYRARDNRLGRDVAIKVLPDEVRNDSRRLTRLESEARLLASLNHPNVATLHGLERSEDGTRFLVMELVEGETLGARIGDRPLPLPDVYRWGAQIAGALAAAHRRGIIHRDLKPDNVMLTRSGVKLLDFGLAKATNGDVVRSAESTTLTHHEELTALGTIVGTLHYMAPEQLEGRKADARSDVFALGCVLYQMATGRKAFSGESSASAIAAILSSEPPPIVELQPLTPPALGRAVSRCLAKDPEARWQSAHDLMLELEWIAEAGTEEEETSTGSRARRGGWLAWSAAIAGLAATVAMAVIHWGAPTPETRAARFSLVLPENHATTFTRVSPDGRYLSATVYFGGQSGIWVRRLDDTEGRLLPGTEGLRFHFWSPDSRSIGFVADRKLKVVDVSGGPPRTLCDAPGSGPFQLGAWGSEGTILFRVDEAPGQEGLYRVPAGGGTPTRIRAVDDSGRELLVGWPSFLPDGRHFLAMCATEPDGVLESVGICAVAVDSGRAKVLLPDASYAEYAAPGYLVHAPGGVLTAHPFDAEKLRVHGEPFRIAGGLEHWDGMGSPSFSTSRNGVLIYQTAAGKQSRLVWMDRRGAVIGAAGSPGEHVAMRLSPDGERLALTTVDAQTRAAGLWILELARNVATRLTSSPEAGYAVWSPDGRRIVYCLAVDAPPFLHHKPLDGGEEEVLLASSGTVQCPSDFSLDGRFLLFQDRSPSTSWDVWVLPLEGDGKPVPFLDSAYSESQATFSPDGRWVAFVSDESGEPEVYVLPLEGRGERRRVSTAGGWQPAWRRDGEELFYIGPGNQVMAVPVQSGASLELGSPVALFSFEAAGSADTVADVSADGQRFLVNVAMPGTEAAPTVVLDWAAD